MEENGVAKHSEKWAPGRAPCGKCPEIKKHIFYDTVNYSIDVPSVRI